MVGNYKLLMQLDMNINKKKPNMKLKLRIEREESINRKSDGKKLNKASLRFDNIS